MNSTTRSIAGKDFADAVRSRLLWGIVALLVVISVPSVLNAVGRQGVTRKLVTESITTQLGIYVPIVAMLVAFRSVVGERESGSLRVLLGLSGTRRDVVVGKLLGRSAVVLVALVLQGLVAGLLVLVGFGAIHLGYAIALVCLVGLYGVTWTGFAVGVSAAVASRFRAIVAVVVAFVVTTPAVWNRYLLPAFGLLFEGETVSVSLRGGAGLEPVVVADGPTWYLYAQRLNPVHDFAVLSEWVYRFFDNSIPVVDVLPNLFGLAMLFAWVLVPVTLGYRRFAGADLR